MMCVLALPKKTFLENVISGCCLPSAFIFCDGIQIIVPADLRLGVGHSSNEKVDSSTKSKAQDTSAVSQRGHDIDNCVSLVFNIGAAVCVHGFQFQRLLAFYSASKSTQQRQAKCYDVGWDRYCLWPSPTVEQIIFGTMSEYWNYLTQSMKSQLLEQLELAEDVAALESNIVDLPSSVYSASLFKSVSPEASKITLPMIVWLRTISVISVTHQIIPFNELASSKVAQRKHSLVEPFHLSCLLSKVTVNNFSAKPFSRTDSSMQLRSTSSNEVFIRQSAFPVMFLFFHSSPLKVSVSQQAIITCIFHDREYDDIEYCLICRTSKTFSMLASCLGPFYGQNLR
jgi:hypothetical protein